MATWIVIGSSTSAVPALVTALAAYPEPITITTNSGLLLCERLHFWPHLYWLSDQFACQKFGAKAMEARELGGTILLTAEREDSALVARGVRQFDGFLQMVEPEDQRPVFTPGQFTSARFSGLQALQIAVNSGAERVVLVGMDGYRGNLLPDSWDGLPSKAHANCQLHDWIGPFTQSVFDNSREVEFELIGQPAYHWSAPNLKIHEVP